MKKRNLLPTLLLVAMFAIGFMASEEEPSSGQTEQAESAFEKDYFKIEDAEYKDGEMPKPTTDDKIIGLTFNDRALPGGMNIITIVTDKEYKRFYIGAKNVPGYLVYTPESASTDDSSTNTYSIPVLYSATFNQQNIIMLISGEEANGTVTDQNELEVFFVDSKLGDLNINLTFSNAKDIDLHLFMPEGEHIFYGHRGGTKITSEGKSVTYGLDHDSNAGCHLDNLNNENIYIPAELIQSGTYRVVVDMYSNCKPTIATTWSVVARYKDKLVVPTVGANPAHGVYPIGAGNDDMTTVMEFTIDKDDVVAARSASKVKASSFVPTPLSDMDVMKLEELEFRRADKQ